MKNSIVAKKINLFLAFLFVAIVFLLLSYKTILIGAGNFLAPERNGKADVVILEGSELIKWNAVKMGIGLLSSEKVNRLVVVVHQVSENAKPFALPDYPLLISKNLEDLGLKKNQFLIITVPIYHPITLTEARNVLSILSQNGVRSTILLAEGFHTRRSYWVYKQVGLPLGIEVIPYPYFADYQKDIWWQQIDVLLDYVNELLKYIYYLIRGYIPFKSLFVT
jgi:uncharacterized SAM-binding protein YcdF (DUF218 family)